MTLLHIVERDVWEAAEAQGEYRPPSLGAEGFIHLSTPEQVLFPANAFYRGRRGLLLLVIDAEKLAAPLKWERADNQTFPHLYGPLNLSAVTAVVPFAPGDDGRFTLPPLPSVG